MEVGVVELSSSCSEADDEGIGGLKTCNMKRPYYYDDDLDDDVLIIETPPEDFPSRPKKRKQEITDDDDDDECLVLEHDPDKVSCDPSTPIFDDDDSDDLVVTAEKGEVACRDFPHPRHMCVKFPFQSTPHVMFCQRCHCYPCDKPAPCSYWGDGTSDSDHCHATDEEKWKRERSSIKLFNKPSLALPMANILHPQSMKTIAISRSSHLRSVPAIPVSSNNIPVPRSTMLAMAQKSHRPLVPRSRERRHHLARHPPARVVSSSSNQNRRQNNNGHRVVSYPHNNNDRNMSNSQLPLHRGSSNHRSNGNSLNYANGLQSQQDPMSLSLSLGLQQSAFNCHQTRSRTEGSVCQSSSFDSGNSKDVNAKKKRFDDLIDFLINSDIDEQEDSNRTTTVAENQDGQAFMNLSHGNNGEASSLSQLTDFDLIQSNMSQPLIPNINQQLSSQACFSGLVNTTANLGQNIAVERIPEYVKPPIFEHAASENQNFSSGWYGTDINSLNSETSWHQAETGLSMAFDWDAFSPQTLMENGQSTSRESFQQQHQNKNETTSLVLDSVVAPEWSAPKISSVSECNPTAELLSLDKKVSTAPEYILPLWEMGSVGENPSTYL